MMKQVKLSIPVLLFAIGLSSCLKNDLPKLPLWGNDYINNVFVEYRYDGPDKYYGKSIVAYQKLVVSDQVIDSSTNTVKLKLTVPAPLGSFTSEEREKVSQDHLWVYMDISTAATITPVGSTPPLGDPTDLTVPQTYEVTAANGDKRTWIISVTNFIK